MLPVYICISFWSFVAQKYCCLWKYSYVTPIIYLVSLVSSGSGRLYFANAINAIHWKELDIRCVIAGGKNLGTTQLHFETRMRYVSGRISLDEFSLKHSCVFYELCSDCAIFILF